MLEIIKSETKELQPLGEIKIFSKSQLAEIRQMRKEAEKNLLND